MNKIALNTVYLFLGEHQPLIDMRKKIIGKCSEYSVPLFATEEALGKRRREKVKRHSTHVGETLFLEMH